MTLPETFHWNPVGVVQDVFCIFWRRHQRGDFHIQNRSHLWRILIGITRLVTRNVIKRQCRQRRDYRRAANETCAGVFNQ